MFIFCEKLKDIDIPETVSEIGKDAFAYSENLKIVIPESVTLINPFAFAYSKKLTICGKVGSKAEQYAISKKKIFQPI